MNAPASPLQFADGAPAAATKMLVNQWRGECLARFSTVEAEMLLTLRALQARDPLVALPPTAKQCYDTVAKALARNGPQDAKALAALVAFRLRHDTLRAFLAHGVAKIKRGSDGAWTATFALLVVRKKEALLETYCISHAEAYQITRTLRSEGDRLCGHLRGVAVRVAG
jgi:hypothetical protein